MRRVVVVVWVLVGLLWWLPSFGAGGSERWSYPFTTLAVSETLGDFTAVDHHGNWIWGNIAVVSTGINASVMKANSQGKLLWNEKFGDDYAYAMVSRVTVDSHDNIIVAGVVSDGSLFLGRVAAYSPDGALMWKTDFSVGSLTGISYLSYVFSAIHTDSLDNIYVAGHYFSSSSTSFLGGRLIALSPDGKIKWDNKLKMYLLADLAVDNKGNPVVVGIVKGSSGSKDWYVASFSPEGVKRWEVTHDGGGNDVAYSVEVDGSNNVVVAGGIEDKSGDEDWYVVSYSPSGGENWHASYDSGKGDEVAIGLAIDSRDDVVVAGKRAVSSTSEEWYVISYSSSGKERWSASAGSGAVGSLALSIAIDGEDNAIVGGGIEVSKGTDNSYLVSYASDGTENWHVQSSSTEGIADVTVDVNSGYILAFCVTSSAASAVSGDMVNYEGTGSISRVLGISDVRVIDPAPENPIGEEGAYLGFGTVVNGGDIFKVKTTFPKYVAQSSNSVHNVPVKIFIAAQWPDNYSVLKVFTEAGDLVEVPPASLSPWKRNLTTPVEEVIYPEVDITAPGNELPVGTYYWYTLVVPDYVPDDLSGVDWMNTPWELTLSVFEVK